MQMGRILLQVLMALSVVFTLATGAEAQSLLGLGTSDSATEDTAAP